VLCVGIAVNNLYFKLIVCVRLEYIRYKKMIDYFLTITENTMSNGTNVKAKQGKKKNTEDVLTSEERENQIRLAAYYRWKENGEKYGSDRDDWFEAQDSV
jgi:Protein of unknown function (DUF2934)